MTGTTRRVSYGLDQSPAFLLEEYYALSSDGRYVAYAATVFFDEFKQASTVQEGYKSVLLRDTVTNKTTLVSVPLGVTPVSSDTKLSSFSLPLGNSPQRESGSALAVSANGRYVVFNSNSPILVAGDTNSSVDFFVRDMVTNTTTRISVDSNENQALYSSITSSVINNDLHPSISADGRYIAFASEAFNLVPGDVYSTNDIFVRDTVAGTTEAISTDSNGNFSKSIAYADADSLNPQITPDGRYVAFASYAASLVPGDTNRTLDIFVKDRQTGKTTRVSTDSNGNQGTNGQAFSYNQTVPSISANGRYVAFESNFNNLVTGDSNGMNDVLVKDMLSGETTRVSIGLNGVQANGASGDPSISADGRYVAFKSNASNLVVNDLLGASDVFVYDRQTNTTRRVSVTSEGLDAVDGFLGTKSYLPQISADGRFVSFLSNGANLANDGFKTRTPYIFLHDTQPGNPAPGTGSSGSDPISGTPSNNPLVGGSGNDVLVARKGAQTLTGGQGHDRFVFRKLDGSVDRITDFEPKRDRIVLSPLLDRVTKRSYKGNALRDKLVRLTPSSSGVEISIDQNGLRKGGFQALVLVEGLSVAQLKQPSNFIF